MQDADSALDQELIDRTARQLDSLDEQSFEASLDKNVAQPIPEMTRAFRRPFLAHRSWATSKKIVSRLNNSIAKLDTRDPVQQRRKEQLEHQRTLVGFEGNMLKHIVDNERLLAGGTLPTAPNPRSQAARELQRRYPVEFLNIVREKEAEIKAKAKAEAKARRAERVAGRSSTGGTVWR